LHANSFRGICITVSRRIKKQKVCENN